MRIVGTCYKLTLNVNEWVNFIFNTGIDFYVIFINKESIIFNNFYILCFKLLKFLNKYIIITMLRFYFINERRVLH